MEFLLWVYKRRDSYNIDRVERILKWNMELEEYTTLNWYHRWTYWEWVILVESSIKDVYRWYSRDNLFFYNPMFQKHMKIYLDLNDTTKNKEQKIKEYVEKHLHLFNIEFNKHTDTYILERVKELDKQLNEIKEFIVKYKKWDELEYTKAVVITNLAERYLEHLNWFQELLIDKWKFSIFQTTFTRIKDAYQHILSGKKE